MGGVGCVMVVCMSSGIPTTSKWVNLKYLHPEFVRRLEAFFADSRIKGKVKVVSACRTYADQARFYRLWKEGKGNLAANPDRRFGPNGFWRGSWHMQQDDGWCYAVDLRLVGRISWQTTWAVAKEYGIIKTVPSENWHMQGRNHLDWYPAPALDGKGAKPKAQAKPKPVDKKGILAFISEIGKAVRVSPLRYRDRGMGVEALQNRLSNLGYNVGPVDGIFGKMTLKAVKNFQRVEGLYRDGIVGPLTWAKLWEPDDGLKV